jgi:signal transduction histidine kinase
VTDTAGRRLVSAWMADRQRLAARLHDGPQQDLAIVALGVGRLLRASGDEEARFVLAGISRQLAALQASIRAIATDVYPPALDAQGLTRALEAEAARAPIALQVDSDLRDRLAPEVEATVLLCVRAAVDHVAAAGAAEAAVELHATPAGLTFSVRTAERVAAPATPASDGLVPARQLLEVFGGMLECRRDADHGTTVHGSIPV